MFQFGLCKFRYVLIFLFVFVYIVQINSRAVSYNAYSSRDNITRQSTPYTVAIIKSQQPEASLHTTAVGKPFVSQTGTSLVQSPLIYKPFLQPNQFMLVDEGESHEGEVLLENDEISQQSDVDASQQYYTIDVNQELSGSSSDDADSYLPVRDEAASDNYYSNFSGYPAAMPPAKNFTGYPDAAYTTAYPVFLTTQQQQQQQLLDLSSPALRINDTRVATTKNKLYALYYVGYKFWYGMLLFVVYHAAIVLVFYLSKLAKHYSRFPAALQAAAASADW